MYNRKFFYLWIKHILKNLDEMDRFLEKLQKYSMGTSLVAQWLRIAFQCVGHGFDPWLGNLEPTCHGATKLAWTSTKKKYIYIYIYTVPQLAEEKTENCTDQNVLKEITKRTRHIALKTQVFLRQVLTNFQGTVYSYLIQAFTEGRKR